MNATDEMPEGEPNNFVPLKSYSVKLPSRDQITAVQVNTLLQAAQTLNHIVMVRGDTDAAIGGAHDGGVCAAADSTIVLICAQLDSIFDEASRWRLSVQDLLEKQLSEVYAAHLDLLKTQKEEMKAVNAPHRAAMPKLLQLEGGQWAAILGDTNKLDSCMFGVGDSPAAALADFDAVFLGQNKNKTNEQSQTVDGIGNKSTQNPPSSGERIRRDLYNPGANVGELPTETELPPPLGDSGDSGPVG